jgi:hypothetical protein
MDCKTARLLLDFARPGELDAAEADALEAHLAGCAECEALARAERQLDRHLGRAVSRVDVPAGLRGRLLARLEADRGAVHRRWAGHGLRAAAAAAALLVAAWGVREWSWARRPEPNLTAAWEAVKQRQIAPPDRAAVGQSFASLGVSTELPRGLNYALLRYYGVTEFQGERVPQLVFIRADAPGVRAEVRILSDRQFKLADLPADARQSEEGYPEKVELEVRPSRRFADLFVYTGDDLGWLRARPDEGETD